MNRRGYRSYDHLEMLIWLQDEKLFIYFDESVLFLVTFFDLMKSDEAATSAISHQIFNVNKNK